MEETPRAWRDVCLEDLAALVPERIMERGRACYSRSQVVACLVAHDSLAGSVLGSAGWYTTTAVLADGRIKTTCTCPYQGAPCKHAVALIVSWLDSPGSFLDLPRALSAMEAGPEGLRRLCLELCLAAPQRAIQLLAGEQAFSGTGEAAAALAHSLLSWPRGSRPDVSALTERLSWVGERLAAALTHSDQEAAGAAVDLAERLLSVWASIPTTDRRLATAVGSYLRSLADAWPKDLRGQEIDESLHRLWTPEAKVFTAELSLLMLAAGSALPDEPPREHGREVMRLLECGPQPELVKAVSFESLLLLLDAYERWDRPGEAIALAKAGLRRPVEGERYALRRRLAGYHQERGERRQALPHLAANFRARPDVEGWELLYRTGVAAGEWARVRKEVWPVVLAGGRELRAAAALAEKDRALLAELAGELGPADRQAIPVWMALAEIDPERGLAFLLAGTRAYLSQGGHMARRQAANFLRVLGRVCRDQDWLERWSRIRAELREEFPLALGWPELGSLLRPPEEG